MKIWVDDMRPAPPGYLWVKDTDTAIYLLKARDLVNRNGKYCHYELIDLDHDAGDYASKGGDYIEILKWMESHNVNDIPIRLHTQNPVGRMNMRAIIEHNGWKEV